MVVASLDLVASGDLMASPDEAVAIGHLQVSKSLFSSTGQFDKKLEVCVGCHGINGAGDADFGPDTAIGTPALRGLAMEYMVAQLDAYRVGTRQQKEMTPMVALLSPEDSKALSVQFAQLSVPAPTQSPASAKFSPALIKQGESITLQGAGKEPSTACVLCHQTQGLGAGAVFPRLAGQNAVYITNQLNAWRSGSRKNSAGMPMSAVAQQLSDDDIKAVSAYFESLVPR